MIIIVIMIYNNGNKKGKKNIEYDGSERKLLTTTQILLDILTPSNVKGGYIIQSGGNK